MGRIAVVVCCYLAIVACEATPRVTVRSFDESSSNKEVSLRLDERFEIALSENPTTGYLWKITGAAPAICALTGDRFEPSGRAPGRGGTHHWFFRAVGTGEATITLERSRSFEESAPAQHFQLRVRVMDR
jgi:inhibitor of cysteine peptidase